MGVYPGHSGHDSQNHRSDGNPTSATYHLGKLILSDPEYPHLENGIIKITITEGCNKDQVG